MSEGGKKFRPPSARDRYQQSVGAEFWSTPTCARRCWKWCQCSLLNSQVKATSQDQPLELRLDAAHTSSVEETGDIATMKSKNSCKVPTWFPIPWEFPTPGTRRMWCRSHYGDSTLLPLYARMILKGMGKPAFEILWVATGAGRTEQNICHQATNWKYTLLSPEAQMICAALSFPVLLRQDLRAVQVESEWTN